MTLGIVYHMPFWRAADGTLREVEGSFARYVDSLAPYFDEIVLCVPELAAPRGEGTRVHASNVTLAPLPNFDGPVHFYPKLPGMLPSIVSFVSRVDLLHCRVPTPAGIFAFAAARWFRKPAFLLVVGDLAALLPTMPYRGLKRLLWRAYTAFEEWNLQWMADRSLTFANGRALADKHSRASRQVIETKTTTIGLADLATRTDTCAGSTIRLLTVSRIDPRKGLRVLPAMLRQLVDRGFDVTLDIIGPCVGAPGEAERTAIVEEAASLGVGDRVRLPGPVPLERLLGVYREYDVFVLPTLPGEGIPRVFMEAMTGGLPVVATRVAGIPSLITDGANGLLVDRAEAGLVADAVTRLVSDPALRQRLIASGYETARAHTLEAQAARLMQGVQAQLGVALRAPEAAPVA